MANPVINWMYKMVTIYLSLWIPLHAYARTLETTNRQTTKYNIQCVTYFTNNVEKCLDKIFLIKGRMDLNSHRNNNNILYFTIYKQYYCKQYEASLQCLHETLADCDTENTISIVQNRLSQPWALATNKLCDINVQTQPQGHKLHENNMFKQTGTKPEEKSQGPLLAPTEFTDQTDESDKELNVQEHQSDSSGETNTEGNHAIKSMTPNQTDVQQTINTENENDSENVSDLTKSNKSDRSVAIKSKDNKTKIEEQNTLTKEEIQHRHLEKKLETIVQSILTVTEDKTVLRYKSKFLNKGRNMDIQNTNAKQLNTGSIVRVFKILDMEITTDKTSMENRWNTIIGKLLFKHK